MQSAQPGRNPEASGQRPYRGLRDATYADYRPDATLAADGMKLQPSRNLCPPVERNIPLQDGVAAAAASGEARQCAQRRADMVELQLKRRGICDPRVLEAMGSTPREEFVPETCRHAAYRDEPLPIGEGQTISQPFMVAAMAEAAELRETERVLEVGAGCGYQAAILARLAREVVAVECITALADGARERLARLGFANVRVQRGDGSGGWPAEAPYDAIVVSAAAPQVPRPLVEQLTAGGRLVIPVGESQSQELVRIRKRADGSTWQQTLHYCRYVPLVGEWGWGGTRR